MLSASSILQYVPYHIYIHIYIHTYTHIHIHTYIYIKKTKDEGKIEGLEGRIEGLVSRKYGMKDKGGRKEGGTEVKEGRT